MISGAATNLPSWACRFEKSELENNQSNSEAAYQYFQNQYRKAHSEAEATRGQIIEIKTDRDQKVTLYSETKPLWPRSSVDRCRFDSLTFCSSIVVVFCVAYRRRS